MGKLTISLYDEGADRLHVVASDGENRFEAFGWVSAIERHWDPGLYETVTTEDGEEHLQLGDTGRPRKMTRAEIRAYALQLLAEQAPGFTAGTPLHSFKAEV